MRGRGGVVNDLECGRDRSVILHINWTLQVCFNSFWCWLYRGFALTLLSQTFVLLVFFSLLTNSLSTECKRWKDTEAVCFIEDKTWLAETKVMKLHHSYQQIGTSSQQTHTSQVSMKMWSKVGQENPKKKIQLHC